MSGLGIPCSDEATRVLIADDHPVTCLGLTSLITAQGWRVCATAADGEEAVVKTIVLRPDIVIMNYSMPRLNGLEAARRIKRCLPEVEVLMFTGTRSRHVLLEMFHSNARGCLLKTEAVEELVPALESLRRHHTFRSRQITEVCEKIRARN